MKKITLFVALLCSLSAFSTRYLVDSPTITWRAAGAGEVNVTSASSAFNTWFVAATGLVAGDEVWMAGGTYPVSGVTTLIDGVSIYGSFAGTETSVSQRIKNTNAAWDFTNQTVIDGGQTTDLTAAGGFGGLSAGAAFVNVTYYDGLKITRFYKCFATTTGNGCAVVLTTNGIMQNCIVSNNKIFALNSNSCAGVFVSMTGAKLLNSHINSNQAVKLTGTTANAGGVMIMGDATVKGCTIDFNTAASGGAGLFISFSNVPEKIGGGTVEDCIIKSNSAYGTGGGLGVNVTTANLMNTSIKNCQFSENTALGNGGGMSLFNKSATTTLEGCKFIGNSSTNGVGGLYVADFANGTASVLNPINKCIFSGNKNTAAIDGAAFNISQATTLQNCIIVNNTGVSAGYMTKPNVKVYNCTFANNAAIALKFSNICEVKNNIFWYNSDNTITGALTPVLDFNAYTGSGADTGAGSISTLGLTNTFDTPTSFVGVPADDIQKAEALAAKWNLKTGCPAVDTGTNLSLSGVTTDITGGARPVGTAYDMGAYELGSISALNDILINNAKVYLLNHTLVVESNEVSSIVVYNMSGMKVFTSQNGLNHNVNLMTGAYIVKVNTNLGNSITKVLVK